MATSAIPRTGDSGHIEHYLADYDTARRTFSWEAARRELTGSMAGEINIATVAVDRPVERGLGERIAARFIDRSWSRVDLTYADLQRHSNRFANVLDSLGIRRGDCVATLLGRVPELFAVALGTLRSGAVLCSLFSAFGPEPLKTRLQLGHARVLVTTEALYRRKVAGIRDALQELKYVLIVREGPGTLPAAHAAPGAQPAAHEGPGAQPAGQGPQDARPARIPDLPAGSLDFDALLRRAGDTHPTAPTRDGDVALLHFTSGTTGKPKGVTLTHGAVIAQHATSRMVLDLHPGEIYWCTADPGWVTGIAYGLIGPLTCGATLIVDREEFDPERWYRILAEERINVWYTAPTAIRMLMKAGAALTRARAYPQLRLMASVGEPLNAEAVIWGSEAFGMPFRDTWWQTETGAIMIANFAACDVLPGSMGRAVPGIEACVVRRRPDRSLETIESPEEVGEIALRPGWPSMFSSYLENEARYRECFVDGWYLAGDLARRDAAGYFWFIGRADDVIKSAGHLISPFEVESALMTHPAVAQVGVIGVPDPIAGQAVKAFIELRNGFEPTTELNRQILGHARRLLGAAVAPREIAFTEGLPRTRSGKIMRRLLRARELGLPEGDLSTLEGGK